VSDEHSILRKNNSGRRENHIPSKDGLQTPNPEELARFCKDTFGKVTHIAEPYVNSTTKSGHAFTLRLNMKRGEGGKFVHVSDFCAITPGIAANINTKGSIRKTTDEFLEEEFPEDKNYIKSQITLLQTLLVRDFRHLHGKEILISESIWA